MRTGTKPSFARCRQGAAAAEFALLLPVLMLVLLGTLQYGMLFFSYNEMESAARDATRAMAVCDKTKDDAKAKALKSIPGWITDVTVDTNVDTATKLATTVITASGSSAAIIKFVPMPAQLSASASMLLEDDPTGVGSCTAQSS